MTTLVTGSSGQLSRAFKELLKRDVVFADRDECDLSDPEALHKKLNRIGPDIVINCAAYTDVDEAENHPELAFRVNSDAVGEISAWCAREGARLIHFSTDYVFDGKSEFQYTEQDIPNPLSIYGKSKRLGEKKFLESGCNGICLRTSWLHSGHGTNFFLTMMRLLNTQRVVHVVDDQTGVPTTTKFLADMTLELLKVLDVERLNSKILHACPSGQASWYEFAIYIQERMERENIPVACREIVPISSSKLAQMAPRPPLSALSNRMVTSKLPVFDMHWQTATDDIVLERNLWNR